MKKTKLFEAGVDGGGFEVFRLEDGSVVETGSSGGMLDEDPIIGWKNSYPDFETFFQKFKQSHNDFWICFYPVLIHEEVKVFIRSEVASYADAGNLYVHCIKNWLRKLDNDNEF